MILNISRKSIQQLEEKWLTFIFERRSKHWQINKFEFNFFTKIDYYFNNRKIDLEIDGKQHKYTDRQESDIKRDIYIKSKGIEVYRIEWNEINSDKGKLLMKEKIDNFLNYIKA